MNAVPFMTPNSFNFEPVIIRKEYKAVYGSNFYNIIIEKTNNNIIIRINYFEIKLNIQSLSLLTNTIFNSNDKGFEFIINIFNQNNYYIKDILFNKITLRIIIYDIIQGNKKEIDIELCENFEDKNYLIKELFNNYIKLENNINYINNDNKLLKEENNNLKNEIYNLKQNYNNDINELKMQIMNYNNMINQIQQQLNQINNIYQEINSIKNQINTMHIDINSINLNNKLSLNNINEDNKGICVIFRASVQAGAPIEIQCDIHEKISSLIKKYRYKSGDYSYNRIFVYNAKRINIYSPLTIAELGLFNNANIFVLNTINYRLLNDCIHVKFKFFENSKLSSYLGCVDREFALNSSDIINYIYNSKKVGQDYIIKESEVKDNSEIIIKLNKHSVNFINIKFQSLDESYEEATDLKCCNKEKISSIIRRFKEAIELKLEFYLRFLIKKIEIDESDGLKLKMADLTVEDFGLKNNSIIFYEKKKNLEK